MEEIPNQSDTPEDKKGNILGRIEKDLNVPYAKDRLANLPSRDLHSLLLEVMDSKSKKTGVSEINTAIEENPNVIPSDIPQIDFVRFDTEAYSLLPNSFRSVDLSPLVPFATSVVLSGVSQKRILSTAKKTEVVSDPTTALALQCAKERIEKIKIELKNLDCVDLATSHRVVRQNKLVKEGQNQHFRSFTIMSASRDVGSEIFEKQKLKEQLTFILSLVKRLNETGGYSIQDVRVVLSDVGLDNKLIDIVGKPVFEELSVIFPDVCFSFDLDRKTNYYKSLCYTITAKNNKGESFSISGGGMTDWTEKLVGSKKEKLMFSTIGSEILCGKFKI